MRNVEQLFIVNWWVFFALFQDGEWIIEAEGDGCAEGTNTFIPTKNGPICHSRTLEQDHFEEGVQRANSKLPVAYWRAYEANKVFIFFVLW